MLLVIVGLTAYIAIDKFGTPSVQVVEYAPAPGVVPTAPVQPDQVTQSPRWQQPSTGQQPSLDQQAASTSPQAPVTAPQQGESFADDGALASVVPDNYTGRSQSPADLELARLQTQSQIREQQQRLSEMREIQAELMQLMQDPNNIEISDLAMIISRLEESQGTSVIGGIDMAVMRNNLEQANRMQTLGAEMNAAVQRGASQEELQQYAEQMEAIQGSLSLPQMPIIPQ